MNLTYVGGLGVGAIVGYGTLLTIRAWRERKAKKTRMAAVYGTREEEPPPIILTPARIKMPMPEDYDDRDD